jgi:5-methylcytosine-specific restriction endonuclease McrA
MITKRQLQKKATKLRHKEKRKIEREIKKTNKQKYKDWSKVIKERDKFTCFICGKYLKDGNVHNLQVHHILAKKTYPELMLDLNNGITLCYYDHKNSKYSPHLNALSFIEILKIKKSEQYNYLINWLKNNELELKDDKML